MADPKQARSQGAAARGASTGAPAKTPAKTSAKKSNTRGGRPDAQPGGGGARGKSGAQAARPNGGPPRPPGTSPGQRDDARPGRGQSRTAAAPARDTESSAADPGTLTAPPWLQLTTLLLSLAGAGVSVYLTIAHYTTSSILACSGNGTINCAKVTTSPESIVFGIFPVAVLGLAFYVFMVAVNTPWAWRARLPVIRWARLGSVIIGMVFVLYLVYTELFTLNAICLWCTSVHVITFLLFALIVASAAAGYGVRPAADRRAQPRR
jgi:uncharacterized membrane protein